jgi:hypothetical protein
MRSVIRVFDKLIGNALLLPENVRNASESSKRANINAECLRLRLADER